MVIVDEAFIEKYSKKIMGFSFLKTKNTYLAQDLSQEILLQLIQSIQKNPEIESIDSYVYTLCCYTWSKFLRSNKKHWKYQELESSTEIVDKENVSQLIEDKLMIEKMKQELGHLGKLHRQITIMYYFENKKSTEIAKSLGINSSTVRWYLGEIRKQLKEGIEMKNEYLNYEPQRMIGGHHGSAIDRSMAGLRDDLLTQNIALACYGEPLTLTEISKRLGVGAAYLEGIIEKLVYMDYLKVIGTRYQTNFFIDNLRLTLTRTQFASKRIEPYATKIKAVIDQRFEEIKAIGFLGHDRVADYLKWTLIFFLADDLMRKARMKLAVVDFPKRKDGFQHFVFAKLKDEMNEEIKNEFSEAIISFQELCEVGGIKEAGGELASSKQLESYLSLRFGISWRELEEKQINDLTRIKQLLEQETITSELDKLLISEMVTEGYIKVVDDKPKFLIPYLTAKEFKLFRIIMDEIVNELGEDYFVNYMKEFSEFYEAKLPKFLSSELRAYHQYDSWPLIEVMGWLIQSNALAIPQTKDEAKSMCTLLFERV